MSASRLKKDYLGGLSILAVARLKNELIGHVIVRTHNDSKYDGITNPYWTDCCQILCG